MNKTVLVGVNSLVFLRVENECFAFYLLDNLIYLMSEALRYVWLVD
jgi:hypothetical protein